MANVPVNPIVLTDVTLIVGEDNFEAHVSQVEFTPSSSNVTWKGLTPASNFTFGTNSTWTVTLAFAQDWDNVNSLSNYLFDNENTVKSITFEPKAGGTSFEADVIITPGAIGGSVDAVATASVTLGVKGKPTRVAAGA